MSASVPRGTRPQRPSVRGLRRPSATSQTASRRCTPAGELVEMPFTEAPPAIPAGLDARLRNPRRRGQEASP